MDPASPHLPRAAQIEAYGKGGFRFAGMSHRGSLLCLPDGIWPCPAATPQDISAASFALVFACEPPVGHCLVGAGRDPWFLPKELRAHFADRQIAVETMTTGAAVRTYNILVGEGRRVAALLIAVD
ncbi:MAG TPA: MTH938/NDUFAF3 family protein [Xanthobacteraceae bacterium]